MKIVLYDTRVRDINLKADFFFFDKLFGYISTLFPKRRIYRSAWTIILYTFMKMKNGQKF